MTNESIKKHSKNKSTLLALKIENELLLGKLGQSGDKFYTVRALAQKYSLSPVTALSVINKLKEKNLLSLYGKSYFITLGKAQTSSPLQKRLSKNAGARKLIGVHVPTVDNPFFSALVNEINKISYQKGYLALITSSNEQQEVEKEILKSFVDQGVSGVISCSNLGEKLLHYYKNYPLPIVLLGNRFFNDEESFVMVNDGVATKQVAEHLVEMGYEHFMYIGDELNALDTRGSSFITALESLGKSLPKENVLYVSNYQQTNAILKLVSAIKNAKKPLGIFCFHDIIATNVLSACTKLKLKVPEEVGIVGFDNLSFASQTTPPLSSITYSFDGMASSAVELLVKKITSSSYKNDRPLDYVSHYLTIRESSLKKSN